MHYQLLAHLDQAHCIGQCGCENSTVQLVWGRATILFYPSEFQNIVAFLGEAYTRLIIGGDQQFRDGSYGVRHSGSDSLQLWLHGVGMHLTSARFFDLYTVCCQALRNLKHGKVETNDNIDSLVSEITDWLEVEGE